MKWFTGSYDKDDCIKNANAAEKAFFDYRDSLINKMPSSKTTGSHLKSNQFAILHAHMMAARMFKSCYNLRHKIQVVEVYKIVGNILFTLDYNPYLGDKRSPKSYSYVPWKGFPGENLTVATPKLF